MQLSCSTVESRFWLAPYPAILSASVPRKSAPSALELINLRQQGPVSVGEIDGEFRHVRGISAFASRTAC